MWEYFAREQRKAPQLCAPPAGFDAQTTSGVWPAFCRAWRAGKVSIGCFYRVLSGTVISSRPASLS
jgi:hypothetical protein